MKDITREVLLKLKKPVIITGLNDHRRNYGIGGTHFIYRHSNSVWPHRSELPLPSFLSIIFYSGYDGGSRKKARY